MIGVVANPLPRLVRDELAPTESPRSVIAATATGSATAKSETIVCRTVAVHADGERLQADLERELRALLGFGRRLSR